MGLGFRGGPGLRLRLQGFRAQGIRVSPSQTAAGVEG